MTLYAKKTLEDGSKVIADPNEPGWEVVLKPGQWDEVLALPYASQKAKVLETVASNTGTSEPVADTSATDRNDQGGPAQDRGVQDGQF